MTLRTAVLSLSLALTSPARAAPAGGAGDVLAFPTVERTLPNGLRVIVVRTGFPDLVSVQIPIQTGSRNEVEPGKSGFAHFFEHMMFRGTKAYPPDAYQAIVTRIGARQNAYTSDDLTNYHLTFAKDDLEKVLEIEADRFMNLDYSVAGVQDRVPRHPRRVRQERLEPDAEARRGPARQRVPRPPLQAHDDGLPRRHRGHAQPVRVLEDVLRALVPARARDPRRGRRRRCRRRCSRSSRGTSGSGSAARTGSRSRASRRRRARCTRTSHGRRPPSRGSRSRSTARRSRTCRRTGRRWTSSSTSTSARRASSTSGSWSRSRRSTRSSRTPAATWTRGSSRSTRGSSHPQTPCTFATRSCATFARARAEPPPPPAARRAEVAHQRNAFLRGLDSTDAIAGTIARYAMYDRSYER